ncbi:hypothetical protein [Streptomyces sp. BA2]|uniref:hypothetical protein n=1 Tax=Streptomyces sp. BA2 TaxID=436595 RepID=UPI001325B51E|nr:hypothetical protein [Streptomyces sp. BA2]MWA15757.1 hypothetical protein [Streptomyces sp. BA2]
MTTPSAAPIDVLLVEDDPGDELMTREAFEDNKIRNTLHVVRDGEEALDFLYQRGEHTAARRPDIDLDQFIAAVRQIDDFFVQVVRLPRRHG